MKTLTITNLLFTFLLIFLCPWQAYSDNSDDFIACLSARSDNRTSISNIVYTPNNSSYLSVLQSSIRNLRFTSPSTPRPLIIVTPVHESQIQDIVHCARVNGMQIRTRSGGHDLEGLSYRTLHVPFIILDLVNLSEITVDLENETAWVQTGATLGQLYHAISQTSRTLAFPAGMCPTVGVGGHISGGGYGPMLRKFGIAADHVIDSRLVDVNAKALDRKSMGEDLFWAIRGGGGASFGVITAWKIRLVRVPETGERKTMQATFVSLFLGGVDRLIPLLQRRFPELGVRREDCNEVSWVQSALFFGDYPIEESTDVLTSRVALLNSYLKVKSDYVQEPIPERGLEGLWRFWDEPEADRAEMTWFPYGGRMSEISESALPFPHRANNLYKILHLVYWNESGEAVSERHVNWMRRTYAYLEPFVSKYPRGAYVNYIDLDLGVNNDGNSTSYAQASVWGFRYFKNNFKRLVRVKTTVDPRNFFRNEQSIPPLYSGRGRINA
ncbi:cannabidiolic acid synthase [Phtheirospermum japonicum]|uniref:Cannabidiolic acid synthase n=1 Tax=Phtheirospermum japonicum TaxID=374723 RepID=A0A830B6C9_9LAMI|nr:cannabidiolic acid synthase [Phtheirospermum japonicum]